MHSFRAAFAAAALIAFAASANAASPYISCTAARTTDERAICRSTALIQRDAEMSTLYRVIKGLVGMGQRGALQDEQADWLKARRACGASVRCLRDHYDDRIAELDGYLNSIRERGPF
jgi:uncharacterized protein